MNKIATIVVPLRVKKANEESLVRLKRLLKVVPEYYEVLVVDDGSTSVASYEIMTICKEAKIEVLSLPTSKKTFSLARSRNAGAIYAKTAVVIFHDVDFYGSENVYGKIAEEIKLRKLSTTPQNFFCIPIAFLTEKGTEKYFSEYPSENIKWVYHREESNQKWVNFVVEGSSCIVTNRDALIAMGGHDETYYGHGAEDFELLHRLGEKYPIADKPKDYVKNMGSGEVSEYRGFRAYFALYGRKCREDGCVLIHIFHPKRRGWGYYKHRRNFSKLRKLMLKSCEY